MVTAVTGIRTGPSRRRQSEAVRADHPHFLRHKFGHLELALLLASLTGYRHLPD